MASFEIFDPDQPFWRLEAFDANGRVIETANLPTDDAAESIARRMAGDPDIMRVVGYYATRLLSAH